MALALIDAGPIIAYYDAGDFWHERVRAFFQEFVGQFITTCPVVTEAMWMLQRKALVQSELLSDLSRGLYRTVALSQGDYARIAELNLRYKNVPADFADLSLIVVSERMAIIDIASLDADFNIYRRYRTGKFNRIFP
jgi:uncharacterized protein